MPIAFLLLAVQAAAAAGGLGEKESGSNEAAADAATCEGPTDDQCGVYIAPSSIPGAGMGLYSAFAHAIGDTVGYPDINFPQVNKRRSVTDHYEWDDSSMASTFEGRIVSNLAPGFGMLANGHYELDNVALTRLPAWGDAGLHRSSSPSAGAFTLMYNVTAEATAAIPAGSEIFLNYGRAYFQARPEYKGKVFSAAEFEFADRLNTNLAAFADKHASGITSEVESKTMKLVQDMLSVIPDLVESTKLVPNSLTEVKRVATVGTARNQFPDSIRSLQWLKDNGWCADNLKAGISTKPARGRGAFATRPIREGDIVAVSPVLHLFESQLEFDIDIGHDESAQNEERATRRKQLTYNYSFGHPDSSLVLFPYAPLVGFINHDPDDANIEVRWADDEVQPEWWREGKKGDVISGDAEEYGGTGMMIEYVASRDIGAGEEVTLKYGYQWEAAWKDHVAKWTPVPNSEGYMNAKKFNDAESEKAVRTVEEQVAQPYPSNVVTACYVEWWRDYNEFEDIGEDGASDNTEEIHFEWDGEDGDELVLGFYSVRPCFVLERTEGGGGKNDRDLYTVQILNRPRQHEESKVEAFEKVIASKVPRKAIIFVDQLYSTDHYLEGAFRHTMVMPGWPLEWKDRLQEAY